MNNPLRPVRPLLAANLKPAAMLGGAPTLAVVGLDQMVVDETYQRGLSERSVALIRRIVEGWDWRQVKALSVMEREDGSYEILDGQHTAIAAATHGGIAALPCLVMPAAGLADKARAFVGLNANRVALTAANLFFSAAAGGDPEALAAIEGARRAGAKILRKMPADARFEPGDVVAVAALRGVANAKGAPGVARLLGICVRARLAPVPASIIRALQLLLWDRAYAGEIEDGDIETVLRATSVTQLEEIARQEAHRTGRPRAVALAATIYRRAAA